MEKSLLDNIARYITSQLTGKCKNNYNERYYKRADKTGGLNTIL